MKHLMKGERKSIVFFLLILIGLFSFSMLQAQAQHTIKGTVEDTKGEAIIGASVLVKGTTVGTVTDFDGNFQLNAASDATLVITYIGYQSEEVHVAGKKTFRIILKEDQKALDEVVVIGYGSVRRNDLTGSVSTFKITEDNKGIATSAQELLAGKIPGVSVISSGGQPGAGSTIRIRGGSSLSANNDPLVVIDGVIMSNETVGGLSNGLSSVNPNDIETFTVLKDASATAIYGSRASNGVILITTKKGSADKVKINYGGTVTISTPRNKYEVFSGPEYRDFINNLPVTEGDEGTLKAMKVALNLYPDANTKWQDEVYRTAISTDHNVSAYGTVKNMMPYRVSIGYTNENGILKTSNFERYSGSFILSPSFLDDYLKVSLNAKGTLINNQFADQGAVGESVFFDPTKPVMNDNKNYGGYFAWTSDGSPDGAISGSTAKNPVALLEQKDNTSKVKAFLGSAKIDYKLHFLPDLKLTANLSYDYSTGKGKDIIAPNAAFTYNSSNADMSGRLGLYKNTFINKLFEVYGTYAKELTSIESHFDIMGGHSYQSYSKEGNNVTYYTSRNPDKWGQPTAESVDYNEYGPEKYVLISFFGRLNYTFKNRYMLTTTMRGDASSRFAKDHRWGFFPSLALGWRMNEEAFLKDVKVLSNLKLRLGWGETGQQDVGGYYPSTFSYRWGKGGAYYPYYDEKGNVTWVNVIAPTAVNPDLKWEETATWNVGFDYGFINNRLNGTIDLYYRKTTDLLNEAVNLPAGKDFAEIIPANIGTLVNKGLEFSVNANVIATKVFNWDVGYNIAYNRSRITELTFNDALASSPGHRYESTGGDGGLQLKIHSPGHAKGAFYVYQQIYDEAGKPIENAYKNISGDGMINDSDLRQYKKGEADVLMGFNSSLRYKEWDFGVNGRMSIGNYMYNGVAANNAALEPSQLFANNCLKNRTPYSLEAGFMDRQRLSDYYIQNASFTKIDNITLGYTFKGKFKPRVYTTVQNPFVFTKYVGLDPEIEGGVDNQLYPRPLMFLIGVNFNL